MRGRIRLLVLLAGGLIAVVVWLLQVSANSSARRSREEAVAVDAPSPAVAEPPAQEPSLADRIRELEGGDDEDDESEGATNRVARVRNEAGEPIEGATFHFGRRVFVTDAKGWVEFLWPEEETTLEFDVRHPGHVDLLEDRTDTGKGLEFVLRSGHTVGGHVVFPSGSPVPEAEVRAWSDESTNRPICYTDENGNFELRGVPNHSVTVDATGVSEPHSWSPGDPPLRMVVPHSQILLRIVGPEGRPVRDARVRLFTIGTERRAFHKEIDVGPRAVYRAHQEETRTAKIIVVADGYRAHAVTVPPAVGAPALWEQRVELVPFEPVPVYVRVRRADGELATSIFVVVLDEDGDVARQVHANPTREKPACVVGAAPGAIRMRVWEQRQKLLFRNVTVDPGGQTVDVQLPGGSRLFVPGFAEVEGAAGIWVRRIDDNLSVGLRWDYKTGFYESASLVPAGKYRAEVVRFTAGLQGARRRSEPEVVRRKEFEMRAGEDHKLDWAESAVAR
ncbi:MAG: carboxypeptidase-like regulatory domain-containing protein [Planctomycetota bacterium]|jgi:hypothetical protein